MATETHLNIAVRISFNQLMAVQQLSKSEKKKLISVLQNEEDEKPTIIDGIKEAIEEVNLAKKGKVKLKSARTFLNEL